MLFPGWSHKLEFAKTVIPVCSGFLQGRHPAADVQRGAPVYDILMFASERIFPMQQRLHLSKPNEDKAIGVLAILETVRDDRH